MYTYQSYYEKIDYDMVAETPEERQEHKGGKDYALGSPLILHTDDFFRSLRGGSPSESHVFT
jgi:hypothetical protein